LFRLIERGHKELVALPGAYLMGSIGLLALWAV
jgi:hypothetical protein